VVISYRNRKGELYYLHEAITRHGNVRYYFARKTKDNLAKFIPLGYEIYESPSSQVYLRRLSEESFHKDEIFIIENYLSKCIGPDNFVINASQNWIEILLANKNVEEQEGLLTLTISPENAQMDMFKSDENFSPFIRIVIRKTGMNRLFVFEKFYKYEIANRWKIIDDNIELLVLLKKHCPKLKSYFKSNPKFS